MVRHPGTDYGRGGRGGAEPVRGRGKTPPGEKALKRGVCVGEKTPSETMRLKGEDGRSSRKERGGPFIPTGEAKINENRKKGWPLPWPERP